MQCAVSRGRQVPESVEALGWEGMLGRLQAFIGRRVAVTLGPSGGLYVVAVSGYLRLARPWAAAAGSSPDQYRGEGDIFAFWLPPRPDFVEEIDELRSFVLRREQFRSASWNPGSGVLEVLLEGLVLALIADPDRPGEVARRGR